MSLDFIVEWHMADRQGWGSGEGGIRAKISLGLGQNFTICPSSCHISKTTRNNDKMGAPTASGNQRHPLDMSGAVVRDSIMAMGL